jgi:hypothetical protein
MFASVLKDLKAPPEKQQEFLAAVSPKTRIPALAAAVHAGDLNAYRSMRTACNTAGLDSNAVNELLLAKNAAGFPVHECLEGAKRIAAEQARGEVILTPENAQQSQSPTVRRSRH